MRLRFFLLAALIIAVGIGGCGRPDQARQPEKRGASLAAKKPDVNSVDARMRKAGIVWRDERGRLLWQAHMSEAFVSRSSEKSTSKLRGVNADLYKDGKAVAVLAAPWIEADGRTREVKAYGGVKIVSNEDGTTATCERIVWKSRENEVYGSGNVKMTRQNMTIVAGSFVSDTALRDARFKDAKLSLH